jgi:threonine/homoserine/homoserine lactone efflux protein
MTWPVEPARFFAFLSVVIVMVVFPGPANLFAVATGAAKGKGAALMAMLGMTCGTLVWLAGAALGLAALIAAWPQAFHVLTYLGAAYLAWLGAKSLWSARSVEAVEAHVDPQMKRSAFAGGFVVQASNPKAVAFFTGLLPPFLDPGRPLNPQLAMLVLPVIGMDMIAMTAYGLGGVALARQMAKPRFRRVFSIVTGALLLTVAALVVFRG